MNPATRRLGLALLLSLLLHGLPFLPALAPTPAQAPPPLQVKLSPPPPPPMPLPAQPELKLPPPPPPRAPKAPPPRPQPPEKPAQAGQKVLAGAAYQQAISQLRGNLLYPPEAIARGEQGTVLVMLFLDAAGNVIAARVEQSSGHPLLDQAAVSAARTLKSLPDSAPRDALLPVRFRLR
ncbi:MAG: hypothetical protein RIR00_1732 [Pseudomonadota bacterium]|jgi:protein TonB